MALDSEPITALDYIEEQTRLEQDARDALPLDPSHCTFFEDSQVRQQLFACLTCKAKNKGKRNVLCYSCSIQCHANHDLVEIFTKRGFTCDCGTERMASFGGCALRKNFDKLDPENTSNHYNHNFDGKYCSCNEPYNPENENRTMIQCLMSTVCQEDWYHEGCIIGDVPQNDEHEAKRHESVKVEPGSTDSTSQASNENNSKEEILPNEFESFVCWRCTTEHAPVWEAIGKLDSVVRVDRNPDSLDTTSTEEPASLKRKLDHQSEGTKQFSLFLLEGYKDELKAACEKNSELRQYANEHTYLQEEEDCFELPDDSDAGSSLLDAGSRALDRLPREQAMSGVEAYSILKEKLKTFFRPFADDGKVVTDDDIRKFFEQEKENSKHRE